MSAGWVKVFRKLADHSVWTRERFTRGQAWVDLILRAAYKDHVVFQGNRAVTVRRGQVLTSQVALHKRWRWDRETVRAFLRVLKSTGMVAIETSKATDTGYTLVTLLKYELYQGDAHEALAVTSAIESAIQTSIHPASTQHPPATIKKGKKSEGRAKDPDGGLLTAPRTPVKSPLTGGPVSHPRHIRGPWEEAMTFPELVQLFLAAIPGPGLAKLYGSLLERKHPRDLLDQAVATALTGVPLGQTEGASAGGARVLGDPSSGSGSAGPGIEPAELVEELLALPPEERKALAGVLVRWGMPEAEVAWALDLVAAIESPDKEMDRQAAHVIEKYGDAHCQAAITETLQEARVWLAEAREMRAHDPPLWDRLVLEEAAAKDGRGGRP